VKPPETIYRFKHALVRDAAYESLLKSRRLQYMARLHAQWKKFPSIVVSQPEIVAHHFTEADMVEPRSTTGSRPAISHSAVQRMPLSAIWNRS
jgi:predicted ATPase